MKRKKWTGDEEETLINRYSELLQSGILQNLKTRQRKFEPIAEHLNSTHHNRDPVIFPFRWSWRDVCIKIQNMRHQYLGVKEKVMLAGGNFNWAEGDNYWPNFLKYKHVFGDHDLDLKDNTDPRCAHPNRQIDNSNPSDDDPVFDFVNEDVLELGIYDEEDEAEEGTGKDHFTEQTPRKDFQHKRERETDELEEGQWAWVQREYDRRLHLAREIDEERRLRMKMDEKREEEEMEWRTRLVGMQMEHEKQIMQVLEDSVHNQMHIMGLLVRVVGQFFGGLGDGLNGGIGCGLPGQVLQHSGGLMGDNGKGDADSGPQFI